VRTCAGKITYNSGHDFMKCYNDCTSKQVLVVSGWMGTQNVRTKIVVDLNESGHLSNVSKQFARQKA
jgi:hypothetical protein